MNPEAAIYSLNFLRRPRVVIHSETPGAASEITIGRKTKELEIFREYPRRLCINVVVGETGWSIDSLFLVENAIPE
jgi:hypothetical protein